MTISLSPLLTLDTRTWIGAALAVYDDAESLQNLELRLTVRRLAQEVCAHVNTLRLVNPRPAPSPSMSEWGFTVAFLLVVSPRMAVDLVRLFLVCVSYRFPAYVAIAMGVTFMAGVVLGVAGWFVWN